MKVDDDSIILDPTVADQVSLWRSSRGLTEECVVNHACSGKTCSYSQIGNVFLCEKTGRLHGKVNLASSCFRHIFFCNSSLSFV